MPLAFRRSIGAAVVGRQYVVPADPQADRIVPEDLDTRNLAGAGRPDISILHPHELADDVDPDPIVARECSISAFYRHCRASRKEKESC